MPLQDIINTILHDAEKQASQIKEKGQEEVDDLRKKGSIRIEKAKKEIAEEAALEQQKKLSVVRFRMKAKAENIILKEKRKLIDKVYTEVLKKLEALDGREYLGLMKKLFSKLPFLEKAEIVSVRGKETLTKQALKEANLSYPLSSDSIEGKGGFILKSDKVEIDNRFETLVEGIKSNTEEEVAKILFQNTSS